MEFLENWTLIDPSGFVPRTIPVEWTVSPDSLYFVNTPTLQPTGNSFFLGVPFLVFIFLFLSMINFQIVKVQIWPKYLTWGFPMEKERGEVSWFTLMMEWVSQEGQIPIKEEQFFEYP